VLGPVDHVGWLVRHVEAGIAFVQETFGLPLVRRFERPQYSLLGAYLGAGTGSIEVFTFTDASLLNERLGGANALIDHIAYVVADIGVAMGVLRGSGVRFSGPDLRGEINEPVVLGRVRHIWTRPETSGGICIQLLEY
jgi:catechol 2,3-dioxygenase-like lactoylglutathione lyase family enzyme